MWGCAHLQGSEQLEVDVATPWGHCPYLLFHTPRTFPLCGFLLELFPPPGLPSSLLLLPLKSFKPTINVFLKSYETTVFLGLSQSNSSFLLLPQRIAHPSITKGQKTPVESVPALASDRRGFASQPYWLLAVQPWACYLVSLSSNFFICKMGRVIPLGTLE